MALDKDDLDRLKELFITRAECDEKTAEITKKQTDSEKELEVIKSKLDTLTWLSKTILAAVLVAIVGAVLAVVFK